MENFGQMLGQMKEIQAQLQELQQNVGQIHATGESGAGLVKVTVNGNKRVIKIDIDPSIIQLEEQQTLQNLVVAAVNIAIQSVEAKIKDMVGSYAGGIFGHLPTDLMF